MSVTNVFLLVTVVMAATIDNPALCLPAKKPLNGRKVVLMSMDGFRHDYLSKANTPNFDALIASGAKVPYVNNTFATLTFPCHYTIVTGRYEESHGIVGNKMYDPVFDDKFTMSTHESRWWNGSEPIWTSAVKAGLKVGTYFWPGTEVELDGIRPTEWRQYTYKVDFEDRVDILVNTWLSKEDFDFGIIYFNEPDHTGHKYGPDGPEMVSAIERMDGILGYFMKRLGEEDLKDSVDFILTSDHGMTEIFQDMKTIGISDYVNDTLLLDVIGGGAIAHLRPQPGKAEELVQALSGIDNITVYLKEDIPDRYHYKHHRRVMPVVVVADEGYEVREKSYPTHLMKATHGYSSDYMDMKPIFIASGPSFKQGVEVDPIKSVDIYPLLCHLLKLDPVLNNGSFERVQPLLRNASSDSSNMKNSIDGVTVPPVATTSPPLATASTTNLLNGRKVVLMSMDGFRHDYLSKANTPNFDALIASGAKVPYVNNTFTTLTFPCHYTIVTGRYEESHGIVDNKMYDPVYDASFKMGNAESRWWNGSEPIWTNAVKAGLKVGTYFWPGSETELDGHQPTEWRPYEYKVAFKDRVDILVTTWLTKKNFDFGVIYFNEPDHTGHNYGPDGPEMVSAIERMDEILGYFMKRLKQENLTDNVDFILTSDHGMTNIFQDKRTIGIRDYVDDTLLLDVIGGGAIAHLRPQPGKSEELVQALSGIDHITVYLKEDIPDRYHYKHHRRVMPVVVVADLGYEVREVTENGILLIITI